MINSLTDQPGLLVQSFYEISVVTRTRLNLNTYGNIEKIACITSGVTNRKCTLMFLSDTAE